MSGTSGGSSQTCTGTWSDATSHRIQAYRCPARPRPASHHRITTTTNTPLQTDKQPQTTTAPDRRRRWDGPNNNPRPRPSERSTAVQRKRLSHGHMDMPDRVEGMVTSPIDGHCGKCTSSLSDCDRTLIVTAHHRSTTGSRTGMPRPHVTRTDTCFDSSFEDNGTEISQQEDARTTSRGGAKLAFPTAPHPNSHPPRTWVALRCLFCICPQQAR
ncbi:hypothetical protein VTK73DRAFT_7454 [Phialemonium thermophilum]|uniref:Uncharacterized protein n=1 Tax=Phialemonium thermophilum TaxID=223376 RepID=A0ABR3WEC0_9PEZI